MSTPRVSICIANYNGMAVIDACLRSVLEQDCIFPAEIIVHDDASTDGSVQHIRANWPQVILIESPENAGFCISNNRMVARARGDYVLLLNNDAELFPNALRTLMATAEALNQPAILGLPQYDAADGHLIDRGSLFDPFLNPIPNLNPARSDVGMVMGACLWIPRALWHEIGGFPEWFGSMAEDMYLCCVARLWGYPVRVLPSSGFRHWVGHSFGGGKVTAGGKLATSRKRRALSERNKTLVMALTYPQPVLTFALPLHLLALSLEGTFLVAIKRDTRLFREIYCTALKGLIVFSPLLRVLRNRIFHRHKPSIQAWYSVFRWMPRKLEIWRKHGIPTIM